MSQYINSDLYEYATEQVSPVGLYRLVIIMLLLAILMTGMMIATQTQDRHHAYQELIRLKQELTAMQIEESRLLIEQQTFSATPQVAKRAAGELSMYYPSKKEQITGESFGYDMIHAGDHDE